MEKYIEEAKQWVITQYSGIDRRWLEASPPDSYEDTNYKVQIFVLEGSPCKGIVVADWGKKTVLAINAFGKIHRIKTGLSGFV